MEKDKVKEECVRSLQIISPAALFLYLFIRYYYFQKSKIILTDYGAANTKYYLYIGMSEICLDLVNFSQNSRSVLIPI